MILRLKNHSRNKSHLSWLAILSLVGIAGCGGSSGSVPVEGTITLDGQPLADAAVSLLPVAADGPGPFSAKTDSDGKFALGPSGRDGGGAAVGKYFLMVTTTKPQEIDEFDQPIGPPQNEIVPPPYSSGTFKFEVPVGGTTEANFDFKSR